jgi:small-conductance mechanosensitive channel
MPPPSRRVRRTLATVRLLVPALLLGTPIALAGGQREAVGAHSDTSPRTAADSGAPVVLGTDTLLRLYGGLGPFSPAARAAAAADRLQRLSGRLAEGDSIVVTDRGSSSELSVRGDIVMTVLDVDAAPLGVPRAALAQRYATTLTRAARSAAERRSARALLVDVVLALVATALLVALLRLIRIATARLSTRIEALRRIRLRAVRIQNFELLSAGRLSALLAGTMRVLRVVVTLLLLYLYVPLVLSLFPWTAPLSQRIVGYIVHPFAVAWAGFVAYLPNLFYIVAGVVIVRYVLAFLRMLVVAVGGGSITIQGFYPEWAEPTYKIVRVLVLAFAMIVLYPYLPGATSDAFKGVSIFLGILFSLGSSPAIGNMVAGVVLTYTRAFQVGDRVKIGDTFGDVIEKTLLVTRVRTIKNVAVTIPNASVLGGQVINYSTLAGVGGLVLHTTVTIGYDAPWPRVHELLIAAARRTEHVLVEPAPFVLQTSLDDFYVSYELNAATDRPDLMATTLSEMRQRIQETFAAGGVEIMSPHYRALREGNAPTIPEALAGESRRSARPPRQDMECPAPGTPAGDAAGTPDL